MILEGLRIKIIAYGLWEKKVTRIFLLILIAFYLIGFIGPLIAPYPYDAQDLTARYQGPSPTHWFGTDGLGRDLFTRCIYSMRTTAIISIFVAISGSLILGVSLALISGYKGGKIDWLIMNLGYIFWALPGILLLMYISVTIRPGYETFIRDLVEITGWDWIVKEGIDDFILVFGSLSLFSWVGVTRILRSKVLTLRETLFVEAAKSLGASTFRILSKHILPNLSWLLTFIFFSAIEAAIGIEIGLSFLGIGIQPPHPSFGIMLLETALNLDLVVAHPHLLLFPASIVTIWIFTLVQLELAATKISALRK